MLPSDDILTEVTRAVFEAMLGMDVAGPIDGFSFSGGWEVAIDITGRWNGALVLAMPDELAARAAAALLGCGVEAIGGDDIHDAMAELANMIGGNVKSIIPGPNELSLPRRQLGTRHADGSHSLCFESAGIPFVLRVVQAHASAA